MIICMYVYIYIYIYTYIYIYIYICKHPCNQWASATGPSLGIHQRGVQWEGGAVDGGSIM